MDIYYIILRAFLFEIEQKKKKEKKAQVYLYGDT